MKLKIAEANGQWIIQREKSFLWWKWWGTYWWQDPTRSPEVCAPVPLIYPTEAKAKEAFESLRKIEGKSYYDLLNEYRNK